MILFWVLCACLIVIALSFVLPPLLQKSTETTEETDDERRQANIAIYRDQLSELESDLKNGIVSQEQYDQDRSEIQRRLLEDTKTPEIRSKQAPASSSRATVYALALGLPLIAIGFYLKVGEPKGLSKAAIAPPETAGMVDDGRSQQQIEANVTALAKRLETNPSDGAGWQTLARSYSSMERWNEASAAYAKATTLIPDNADLWADYAFATAMAGGRQLQGKPMEFIAQALKLEPDNLKALELSGSAAFQAKDYKKAIEYWQRVMSKVPPGSDVAQSISSRIDEARSLQTSK